MKIYIHTGPTTRTARPTRALFPCHHRLRPTCASRRSSPRKWPISLHVSWKGGWGSGERDWVRALVCVCVCVCARAHTHTHTCDTQAEERKMTRTSSNDTRPPRKSKSLSTNSYPSTNSYIGVRSRPPRKSKSLRCVCACGLARVRARVWGYMMCVSSDCQKAFCKKRKQKKTGKTLW